MATKILIFLSFVALSSAGFVWVDDDNNRFPKLRQIPKFEPFTFKPFVFKPFVFEPITFKPIDVNYQPKEGENFVAVSTSSHHESSNVNGVEKSSGGSDIVTNVGGKINEEGVEFKKGDRDDENNNEERNTNENSGENNE
uniref:Seroin transcript 1B2 n=1 Tax=Galleria mellonella TaxID=7137 RepID=A0A3G1T155_GALME|nr:seroin transcript 1B2 [Galleria mellonella]